MTDSPRFQLPIDPDERPIETELTQIRTKLELLKQDKTNYVKSEDVIKLYEEVIEQVHALNTIRKAKNKPDEQNRVDTILDDCFSLISLSFMTIGKNNEAPAIYSVVSTIKRLLDHLKEAAFYQVKDLAGINAQLQEFRENIARCQGSYDPALTTILEARIAVCQKTADQLSEILSHLTPELAPKWEKLVSILRMLSACNTRSVYPKKEVEDLKRQLAEIQATLPAVTPTDEQSLMERYAEKLRLAAHASQSTPEELVMDLLERCQLWANLIEKQPGYIDERFRKPYEYLKNIRDNLESRSLLQAWSLRETDLFDYQRKLDRIDEARTEEGNFLDEEGHPADLQTQRTLLYFLRKSYALIYQLLTSSEPVSEALLPIYNQLKTLKRCLREVQKAGGVSSPRELYPYSMKLNSIDNMKVDGKFMVGDDIPDGQGAVISLMEECFELSYQLREQAQEASEEAQSDAPGPNPVVIDVV
ncbi:hypothetical protein BLS_007844 [Venturia inaequalis]|uniref:Uncharacterized protein n=1 Tax=Venturia inaequalis TaxID=5025 RepID=A0A8H3U933_VENIN|nr:hypothetical protein BLS_007844 [Venturia inaequalis]KAE9971032.1 hypothetical protein EG328_005911 [Venturia inaequalis]KAE9974502.1 hypothetical protein EG327_008739 [Venturia inaequalis]RDI85235.1 hypothetical protein Vi05172_g4811 [Venturia inaequalis]